MKALNLGKRVLAALLVCTMLLTMISVHMTSGLYARYIATSTGSDSARVAKFDVDCTLTAVDGVEGQYYLSVANQSEVAVRYSIHVELDNHMNVTIGNETKTPDTDNTSVTFTSDEWTLLPGTNAEYHTLQFAVTDWTGLTNQTLDSGETESVSLQFKVGVSAEQVD